MYAFNRDGREIGVNPVVFGCQYLLARNSKADCVLQDARVDGTEANGHDGFAHVEEQVSVAGAHYVQVVIVEERDVGAQVRRAAVIQRLGLGVDVDVQDGGARAVLKVFLRPCDP